MFLTVTTATKTTYHRAPGVTGRTVTGHIMNRPRQSHWSAVRTLSRIVDDVYGVASDFVYAWIEPDRPRLIEVSSSLHESLDQLARSPASFPAVNHEGLLSPRCEVGVVYSPRCEPNHEAEPIHPPILRMAFTSGPHNRIEGVAWFSESTLEHLTNHSHPLENLNGLLEAAASIRLASLLIP